MSESYSRRAFLKRGALTLGMAIMCHLSGMGRAFAVPQTGNSPERTMLIAYFSHTGNTALVAEQIHSLTHGDMHRIRTVEVYPAEHDPCSELAGRQLRAGYRPELASRVDNMASYSIVFLGYPIWWHTMPMVCWTFLESYDFTGKNLSPSVRTAATVLPTVRATSGRCARRLQFWKATTPGTPMPEGCRTMLQTGCGASA